MISVADDSWALCRAQRFCKTLKTLVKMSEKRKPDLVILLRNPGKKKTNKIELFNSNLWDDGKRWLFGDRAKRFRLRVNGRWADKSGMPRKYYTKWQFRDILWKSIKW